MKILFASHCDFTGNSAMHIFSIANRLAALGAEVAVAVPHRPETISAHGEARFGVIDFAAAREGKDLFPDGGGPDLIHAWTTRELVRRLTLRLAAVYRCPYIVHLEDNEFAVVEDELVEGQDVRFADLPAHELELLVPVHRSHPRYAAEFLAGAAGATALMDTLLEFIPARVPSRVFWPGFDPEFLAPPERAEARRRLGVSDRETVLVYTGNLHRSNLDEVRSLAVAVGLLHRAGVPVRLLKTGWNYETPPWERALELKPLVTDLGFLPRARMPELVAAADLLVQPGRSNRFNDYRFPSKLPEFFVSSRPVILPATNIGRFVQDGVQALLLREGHAAEIARKAKLLLDDPERAADIGWAGRAFALEHLSWDRNVPPIFDFYREILARRAEIRVPEDLAEPRPELPVKLIAFYLPQFHPIPENDAWWGPGFTEWSNVSRARPSFAGHMQPNLPSELGFYDLRVPEVLERQAALAREHGIFGFCYYYYWFSGRRLLERPMARMLESGRPDLPFCLCWANENWTRRWDGAESEVLMRQEYSDDADERFIRDLMPFLKDPRYITLDGHPLLLVYRVNLLRDPRRSADHWRRVAAECGLPGLHLAAVQSFGTTDPRPYGFDSAVEFPPHTRRRLIDPKCWPGLDPSFQGYLEDYTRVVGDQLSKLPADYPWFRGVMPAWDNTPRRQEHAHIVVNSSPEIYEGWLRYLVEQSLAQADIQPPLVFINSWNEWAEGAQLEPDTRYGRAHLEATRRALLNGIVEHYRGRGLRVNPQVLAQALDLPRGPSHAALAGLPAAIPGAHQPPPSRPPKTWNWFDDKALDEAAGRYEGRYPVAPLSYATVSDFCDSVDHLRSLATHNGDLKDAQRPWIFKAILGCVPRGSRVLEIGAGEPFVADLLQRLGYEVWVVDPYDGSGHGPPHYEQFKAECPEVHFVRELFSDRLDLEPASFDCIYSISVLEHVPVEYLPGVFAGLRKFLKPDGIHIHAVDHVHKGSGDREHLEKLKLMVEGFGLSSYELDELLMRMDRDTETYYLSAESHNRWRDGVPYSQFPMRVCVSIQTFNTAAMLHRAAEPSSLVPIRASAGGEVGDAA